MNANSKLQEIESRILALSREGKRTPQIVLVTLPRLQVYSNLDMSKANELTVANYEKLVTKIDNALTAAETKEPPKGRVIHLTEKYLDEAAMLKRAGIYAQKCAELSLLEENYQRRKDELMKAIHDAEDKIPQAQLGEFSALVKQSTVTE